MFIDLPLFVQESSSGLAVIERVTENEDPPIVEETYKNQTQQCSSFADELFPTPDAVIERMLQPYVEEKEDNGFRRYYGAWLKAREVLDPSAGKGNILEYVKTKFSYQRQDIEFVACEIEQDLRYVLSEKNFSVIGSDWLEFDEPRQFELILMNPPFSEGVKHLLKAWEHCAPDGDVACVLNAESVKNPYNIERQQLAQLIERYGRTEFIGQAFLNSERPTTVESVIVRLHKPQSAARIEFEGVNFTSDEPIDFEGFNEAPLAKPNVIKNLVAHYQRAREIIIRRHQVQAELNFCLSGTVENSYSQDEMFRQSKSLTEQVNALKARFWNTVFQKTGIANITTSGFQRNFNDFERSQKSMAFSERNILEVLEIFFVNRAEIMQNCIVEVFDELTKYHENCLGEGWRTNSAFQVSKKLIFPYGIHYEADWGFRFNNYYRESVLEDLDKILMYINGDKNTCTVTEAIQRSIDRNRYEPATLESSYFKIRFYKKGTIHLWFLDETLWNEFNRRAAIGKKWIGAEESAHTNRQKRW